MSENPAHLVVEVLLDGGDANELDGLTRQLRMEMEELEVDSIEIVLSGPAPHGTKAIDMELIGQMAVTLAPTVIPPLFELLRSWVERKPSTPVKIKVKMGQRTAQIEYDPTRTSAKDLEAIMKALNKTVKK